MNEKLSTLTIVILGLIVAFILGGITIVLEDLQTDYEKTYNQAPGAKS